MSAHATTALLTTADALEASARDVRAAAESMTRLAATREVALVIAGNLVEDLGLSHERSLQIGTRMAGRVLHFLGGQTQEDR